MISMPPMQGSPPIPNEAKIREYCSRSPERAREIAYRLELAARASAMMFNALREIAAHSAGGPERAAYVLEQAQIAAQASRMLADLIGEINQELERP